MTTTNSHAAPWTLTRYIADLFSPPTNLARNARPALLTGREAAARALYSDAVQGSKLDMLNYDATPHLQRTWLAEADRRIASTPSIPDLLVLRHWGYTEAEWTALPAIVKADKREHFYQTRGLAS